jgi:hypothetical protein
MCAQHHHYFIFHSARVIIKLGKVIIMARTPIPRGKDLVLLCMDYKYYDYGNEANTTRFKLDKK